MAMVEFSSYSDLVAICSRDGIKVFDAMKGEEFSEVESGFGLLHTCMKWLEEYLLVVGTASGEVMALDLFSGQLKWRLKDCHPGGVNAVSFSTEASCIYSAGVDGMVCQTDPASGNLLGKFKASTKAISSMVISPDGKTLATAAAQLKIFNCSNNKKIQKFSGHTGAVRCMIFSEDGKYLLYSSAGESYVALWEIDGSKKQSASCVLSMDHPAVLLDCKGKEGDTGIYVLAVSEVGQCYFWYGKHVEELRNAKPTRISLFAEGHFSRNHKSALPMIFAAVLQVVLKSGSGLVHLVYGSMIKPSFEKVLVTYGTDTTLDSTQVGVLLPLDQSHKNTEGNLTRNRPWPSANPNFIRVKDKEPKSTYKALEGHYYEEMVYTVHNSAAGTSASAVKPKKGVSQTCKSKKGKKDSSHTRSSASQAQLVQHQLAYQQNFQQHQQQLQQHLQTFWASQYQEIEHTTDLKNHSLPLARIKKIMNADKGDRWIAAEAPVFFARACEMFISELTLRSWNHTEENKRRTLQNKDIAAAITRTGIFDFLVPTEDLKDEGIAMPRAGPVPVADLQ